MKKPPMPIDEEARLATLNALGILDTPADERFDLVTRLSCKIFGVPIALVSLIDAERQWFKSCQGLGVSETGRDISFCGHAILQDQPLVIRDATADDRFHDNPLVTGEPGIRFYAGFPVSASNGHKLGTLCLIDREPRAWGEHDAQILNDLGGMVEQLVAALELATQDELTGLLNRRGFDMLAQQALQTSRRNIQDVSLLVFDLDYFKEINDLLGHAAGDGALQRFARALRESFRDSDVVARMGGDEFWVLLPDAGDAAVPALLQRLDARLAECVEGCRYRLGYSVGVATCDPGAENTSIASLSARADARMYEHKRSRRSSVQRFEVIA